MGRGRQQGWDKGECLARDRDKRIGPLRFDYLDQGIRSLLSTTPDRDIPQSTPVPPPADDPDADQAALAELAELTGQHR